MKQLLIILMITSSSLKIFGQVDIITTIAGNDTAGYCCDSSFANIAKFNHPDAL